MAKPSRLIAITAVVALGAACSVHQDSTQTLSGPSELAQSVTVTATPDAITLDGSQATIQVHVRNASGAPAANVAIHLDSDVASNEGCGLAQQNLVTGSDGRASTTFTAPRLPISLPECTGFAPGAVATIFATPVGTNFQAALSESASIHLIAPTVIFPPSGPTVNFTITPSSPRVLDVVTFDGSISSPGQGHRLVDFLWDFGDGETKHGAVQTHDFASATLYVVKLTITDDAGEQTSKSVLLAVQP